MKIIHIANWYSDVGGAETMLFQMLKGLEKWNKNIPLGLATKDSEPISGTPHHKVEVALFNKPLEPITNIFITQKASGQHKDKRKKYFIDNLQYNFSDCRPIKAWFKNRRTAKQILRIIADEKPDIIHNHNVLNPFVNRALRRSKVPVVFHVHDPRLFCFTYWKLLPAKFIGKVEMVYSSIRPGFEPRFKPLRKDRPLCNDSIGWSCIKHGCLRLGKLNRERKKFWAFLWNWQIVRKSNFKFIVPAIFQIDMLSKNGFNRENIIHLPNFTEVDDPYIKVAERRNDTILFVGRASYEKGIMFLLEALRKIHKTKWRLIICASGPQLADVKNRIRELKFMRRTTVISTFSQRRLKRLYQLATVLVMPSVWHETFGLVGIEAMANKCPVIAFDVGGVREWLENSDVGFVYPLKDIDAMSNGIRWSLLNRHNFLGQEQSETCYNYARESFSPQVYIPKLIKIYQDVIRRK